MDLSKYEIPVTEVTDVRIGQTEDAKGGTGMTVIACENGMRAGLDVRGGDRLQEKHSF